MPAKHRDPDVIARLTCREQAPQISIRGRTERIDRDDFVNNYTTTHPNQPWPADIRAYDQEGHTLNKKQAGFMIGGGVAIVGGFVVYMLGRSHAEGRGGSNSEHASLQPTATRSSVGVSLTGRF